MLHASWQANCIHTYQFVSKCFICLWLARYQFLSMSSGFGGMYTSRSVDSKDDNLWNLCQKSSVDKFSPQKIFFDLIKNIDFHVGDMTFQMFDGTPSWNFVGPSKR